MQLLTHSRQDAFKVCRRKHQFSYEWKIRRQTDAKALRMGSAFHDALEQLANTNDLGAACGVVYERYEVTPENYEELDWLYERETVLRLVCGYQWRWQDQPIEHVAAELAFELPLTNPATGKPSRVFKRAGKLDGIIKVLETGRLAVLEHKLLSEDLDSDSPLWKRLRIDHQISGYVSAARALGYPVDCVFYSVTRKPTIQPTNVPILDGDGKKIVLDAEGNRVFNTIKAKKKCEACQGEGVVADQPCNCTVGAPRQTGDSGNGWVLQTRPMTPEEWGEKLSADIVERPEFYFARNEVQRLDQDIAEYEAELWEIQQTLRDAQLNNRHFRTCNRDTCAWCSYFDLCTTGWQPSDVLPEGFIRLDNPHPELQKDETNVNACAPTA